MSRQTIRLLVVLSAIALIAFTGTAASKSNSPIAHKTRAISASFDNCKQLINYARENSAKVLEATRRYKELPMDLTAPSPTTDGEAGAEKPKSEAQAGVDSSQTNVQEEGVDEPDIAKSDGSTIFTLNGTYLKAIDARSDKTSEIGSITLEGSSQELLISGDRALVFGGDYFTSKAAINDVGYSLTNSQTVITEIDISNPAAMRVVHTERVDGTYQSARLTGSTVRVVVGSSPSALDDGTAEGDVRIANWLPTAKISRGRKGKTVAKPAVACDDVRHPSEFSGVGMTTVLTIDMTKGLPAVDSDALMADVDTVYVSPTGLYLTSNKWVEPILTESAPQEVTSSTDLYKFDTTATDQTTFQASGSISGTLLNQWSLSEYKGSLRVVTTDNTSAKNESKISVMQDQGGKLTTVGNVGGIGKDERVYAVRFIGDVGFVVTFRQMDPLYTVDLSNPTDPKILGELKIAGYSAYLHPVGEHLLIGIGQDSTESGRPLGTQLSLFDISDLRNPKRLFSKRLESDTNSLAEDDHRAFLYWPKDKLAVIPVSKYSYEGRSFSGAVAFHVDESKGIDQVGRITHPASSNDSTYDGTVSRSFVVGKRLFTLSDIGIKANNIETLNEESWLPFDE